MKTTLEQKNEAQKQLTADNEHLRLLNESSAIEITGSNRGDGKWGSALCAEDYTAVKEFLQKRIAARSAKLIKVINR